MIESPVTSGTEPTVKVSSTVVDSPTWSTLWLAVTDGTAWACAGANESAMRLKSVTVAMLLEEAMGECTSNP